MKDYTEKWDGTRGIFPGMPGEWKINEEIIMPDPKQIPLPGANTIRLEEEMEMADKDFACVRLGEFYSPRKVVFDLFLRLAEGRYLRIFRAGEDFDEGELKAYEADRGMRYVYFGRSHRSAYIATSASLLEKISPLAAIPLRTKFGVARILSELYMQELYECDDAARRALVDKGKRLCSIMATWVDTQPGLVAYILRLEQIDANPAALCFLMGVFSCLLSHQMPWKSKRTSETLLFACFLSELGIFALSPEILRQRPKRMNKQQRHEYEMHPEMSCILLEETGSDSLNENILLIIRQHHEYCDGTGYPNSLTGDKTIMLAKIVVLCGDIIRRASEFLLPPSDAAKTIFPEFTEKLLKEHPELVAKYERELLPPFFKMIMEGGA